MEFLTGKDYPQLCAVCQGAINACALGLECALDTDNEEAPCDMAYDRRLFCGGDHCANKRMSSAHSWGCGQTDGDNWISTNDRLPTSGCRVLGATPIGDDDWIIQLGHFKGLAHDTDIALIEVGEGWHYISHWMPPPAPPRWTQ